MFVIVEGLVIVVWGGGYSFFGFSVCDDGIVIDFGVLNEVWIDVFGCCVYV